MPRDMEAGYLHFAGFEHSAEFSILQFPRYGIILRGMATVYLESGEYVTVEQAAEIIGCTPAHVRYLLGDKVKEIVGHKLSERVWLVEKASADAYARRTITRGRPRVSA